MADENSKQNVSFENKLFQKEYEDLLKEADVRFDELMKKRKETHWRGLDGLDAHEYYKWVRTEFKKLLIKYEIHKDK